jgi:hypothetical protein
LPPKLYQLLIKSHKTTIFISALPTLSIAQLKSEILSALTSDVNRDTELPTVTSEDGFEISQAVKDRATTTIKHVVVDATGDNIVKGTFTNWEVVFLQFKNESGEFIDYSHFALLIKMCLISSTPNITTGELLPVEYVPPEDDDASMVVDTPNKGKGRAEDPLSVVTGKRKEHPEDPKEPRRRLYRSE